MRVLSRFASTGCLVAIAALAPATACTVGDTQVMPYSECVGSPPQPLGIRLPAGLGCLSANVAVADGATFGVLVSTACSSAMPCPFEGVCVTAAGRGVCYRACATTSDCGSATCREVAGAAAPRVCVPAGPGTAPPFARCELGARGACSRGDTCELATLTAPDGEDAGAPADAGAPRDAASPSGPAICVHACSSDDDCNPEPTRPFALCVGAPERGRCYALCGTPGSSDDACSTGFGCVTAPGTARRVCAPRTAAP